jgi:glycogen debranching enzyme
MPGRAFVRTNLGQAAIIRRETIREVELNEARKGRAWFDMAMHPTSSGRFELSLGLTQVGHFQAKCLFIPEGQTEPLWPVGPNTQINVEPADTVCGNIVYNAFVRQFGPRKNLPRSDYSATIEPTRALDAAGYTVIPPSGTFRDLLAELDFIMGRLGCRIIQLLPIHPTPTTYARMGRFGSPYAALSFTAVDPALAVFDPKATPLEQFLELLDAVHARHGKVIIDIAINHTGWAASLHETHPQWLVRNQHGEIENPGAWGIVWADLTRLDFSQKGLWQYMADVFLTWCRRGVDGFRCDAGYMVPLMAWRYIIAKVREQFPETLFLLEGLGGKIEVTRDLLNRGNFNWAYSELFQNYDRGAIDHYLPGAIALSAEDGVTIHFAETHDNNRLAATSPVHARMRTALCALTAPMGAFGFTNGVEWLATEKINVHEACALNWGASVNQVDHIARLNHLLKTHPAFAHPVDLKLVSQREGNFLVLLRRHRPTGRQVLVVVNLDAGHPVTAGWRRLESDLKGSPLYDLLGQSSIPVRTAQDVAQVDLAPGQALCLSALDDPWLREAHTGAQWIPPAVLRQRLRVKTLEVLGHCPSTQLLDLDAIAQDLNADPEGFCCRIEAAGAEPRVVPWIHPHDLRRQVMVPPNHFLLVRVAHPFQVRLVHQGRVLIKEKSLPDQQGRPYALIAPLPVPSAHTAYDLELTVYNPTGTQHAKAQLFYLTEAQRVSVRTVFSRNACYRQPLLALGTNGRGAMMRVAADWGRLDGRYDALLAANLSPDYPEDRRIGLTRCRAWVVYQGFSQEVNLHALIQFGFDYRGGAFWRYQLITGQGEHIILQARIRMADETSDTVHLMFERLPRLTGQSELADAQPVTLIVRPDIEDRNFHEMTKAFAGPEHRWPSAVAPLKNGFRFAPFGDHHLRVTAARGRFHLEPQWEYMVHHVREAERGQDPHSDLFSPGYFSTLLSGGQSELFTARMVRGTRSAPSTPPPETDWPMPGENLPLETALVRALDQFVVRRGDFNTVIAGFPWFLDWGRDTLIATRGLIAAGRVDTVQSIVLQFARFESQGTLPNMIRGEDARNRDTSDAPLWFFVVCADLAAATGDTRFLSSDCNGRTLCQVLTDMALAIVGGTPNGIVMDPDSGLIFSPSHFTWMDTNFPAGSPRQGYPIEIQALWHAALSFLKTIDTVGGRRWADLADRVKASVQTHFWMPDLGYLCDCRHAAPGQSAAQAIADDALRPNQLLAITLGTVEDPSICGAILGACRQLLVPGAIRSLADRPVSVPLPVWHQGHLLNNPQAPYWGTYSGDEDTRRKPAYHNGTAWTWLFPSFCEAWAIVHGSAARETCLAWLSSGAILINGHCVGQVPEIIDGDAPHTQRGCDAQAWGVSELLRVWKKVAAT